MKKIKIIIALLFLCISTTQAQDNTGKIELEPFKKLHIPGAAKVYITQGESYSLKGNADDLRKLNASVRNGQLTIPGINMKKVYLTVVDIDEITVDGSAKIMSESALKGDNLSIEISGTGNGNLHVILSGKLEIDVDGASNFIFRGNAQNLDIEVSGSGNVDARNLTTENADVEISGVGKIIVDAKNQLDVDISGAGKIYYVTEPAIMNKDISGMGKINSITAMEGETMEINIGDRDIVFMSKSDGITSDTISLYPKKVTPKWAGFEMGFNTLVNSDFKTTLPDVYDFLELNTGKSLVVSLNFFDKGFDLYRKNVMFVTGLGLTYNNYRFEKDFTLKSDAALVSTENPISPYTDSISYMKNKLVASYVTVPVLFQFNTSEMNRKAVQISTGVIGSYRLGSHTKQVYKDGGKRKKDKDFDDFNLNPFRLEATFRVAYRNLNIFTNYSLTTFFKDGEGPDMYPFTVGVRLAGW